MAGTDASDWGTGQIIWKDGGREEHQLVFTSAERRRPINWRELLGIVRVCRLGGERLRGCTVLVEADNMAAVGASSKLSSKSEDMQELVRRLLRLSLRHGFKLRVTHTPGEKLDRPDQTSRGDAVEEPRARLSREAFEEVVSRFGAFSELIGAEREHAMPREESATGSFLWAHPTFNTVGSALRRIGERLQGGGGTDTRALALVPKPEGEQWASMLRHGLVVGGFEAGDTGLERNVLGRWRSATFARPMVLVLFPRPAGRETPRPLRLSLREGLTPGPDGGSLASGYEMGPDGNSFELRVVPGSFVYALPEEGYRFGTLYRVCRPGPGDTAAPGTIFAKELERASSKLAMGLARVHGGPGWVPYELMKRAEVWRPRPDQLWAVSDYVKPVRGGTTFDRFVFNHEEAERVVRLLSQSVTRAETAGWDMGDDTPVPSMPAGGGTPGTGYDSYVHVPTPEEEPRPPTPPGLEEAVGQLDALRLQQSATNRGAEGRIAAAAPTIRDGDLPPSSDSAVVQPCPYSGMQCAGCGELILAGEAMQSCLGAVVHAGRAVCVELAESAHARAVRAESGGAGEATTQWAVFSLEPGASGLYATEAEASRWLEGGHGAHARIQACRSEEEGRAFIRAASHSHALEGIRRAGEMSLGGVRGSSTRRTQTLEQFSPQRMEVIYQCIAGTCGEAQDDSNSTECRGGCGRRLHVASCAGMGSGYAALGNFTCPECRLDKIVTGGARSETARALAARTMVLELGQGAESTGGSYSDYIKLEEAFVATHSGETSGGGIVLPRHNAEAFKNFISWMAMDRDRARSLESIVRSAGALMTKLKIDDVTKDGSVKTHLAQALGNVAMEHEPSTAATPSMVSALVENGGLIDRRYYRNAFIGSREKIQVEAEAVGGCRIGEVCGGGETHGILANESAVVTDPATGTETVEFKIEHSKTGFSRYLDLAGRTTGSGVECARHLRDYWARAGMATDRTEQAGLVVESPDYWVVRVSLVGVASLGGLETALRSDPCARIRADATAVIAKAKTRLGMTGPQKQSKRYVNVAAGRLADPRNQALSARLGSLGFQAQIVPGPLLLATTGGGLGRPTHMPLSVAAAAGPTKELLTLAAAEVAARPGGDKDLDVERGRAPHWSSHSLRRLADTVARRDQQANGVEDAEIDLYFGWHEAILLKEMRRHYAAYQLRERIKQARITRGL